MKRFSELSNEQLTNIVNRSKKLRDELDEYIQDSEMHWISEKLSCVKDSLANWSVGFYNQNFLRVRDYEGFVDGVEKSIKMYGASEKLEKKFHQVQKLLHTNLFAHTAEQLKELWLKEELQSICDYVEDASYELYQGAVGEKCQDYLECFFDAYRDYLYDEATETFYKPTKLAAA